LSPVNDFFFNLLNGFPNFYLISCLAVYRLASLSVFHSVVDSFRSWEWIDDQTFACRERTLSQDKKRLHSREVVVDANRGVVRDQFYSERLYGREELVSLLREAGFDIDISGSPQTAHVAEEGRNALLSNVIGNSFCC
jgi:hypothetical protein